MSFPLRRHKPATLKPPSLTEAAHFAANAADPAQQSPTRPCHHRWQVLFPRWPGWPPTVYCLYILLIALAIVCLTFIAHCAVAFAIHLAASVHGSPHPLHIHEPLLDLGHSFNSSVDAIRHAAPALFTLERLLWHICLGTDAATPGQLCNTVRRHYYATSNHAVDLQDLRWLVTRQTSETVSALIYSLYRVTPAQHTHQTLSAYLNTYDTLIASPAPLILSIRPSSSRKADKGSVNFYTQLHTLHHKAQGYRRKNWRAYDNERATTKDKTPTEDAPARRLWLSNYLQLSNDLTTYISHIDALATAATALHVNYIQTCVQNAEDSPPRPAAGWRGQLHAWVKHWHIRSDSSTDRRAVYKCNASHKIGINNTLSEVISILSLSTVKLRAAADEVLDAVARTEAMRCGIRQILPLLTGHLVDQQQREAQEGGYYRTRHGPVFDPYRDPYKTTSSLLLAPQGVPETCADLELPWAQHFLVAEGRWEGLLPEKVLKEQKRMYGLDRGRGSAFRAESAQQELERSEWEVERQQEPSQHIMSLIEALNGVVKDYGMRSGLWLEKYFWLGVGVVIRHRRRPPGWSGAEMGVVVADMKVLLDEAMRTDSIWWLANLR